MPLVVSVEEAKYRMPTLSYSVQYGYSSHSVPYYVSVGAGRTPILHYRTEYRPDNKTSMRCDSDEIEYWVVTLDDGRKIHLAWYLYVPKPEIGDEFEEYEVYDFPIWVRIGHRKTYSNLVLGAGALAVAGVMYGVMQLFS